LRRQDGGSRARVYLWMWGRDLVGVSQRDSASVGQAPVDFPARLALLIPALHVNTDFGADARA
jgi:hypothetical protein